MAQRCPKIDKFVRGPKLAEATDGGKVEVQVFGGPTAKQSGAEGQAIEQSHSRIIECWETDEPVQDGLGAAHKIPSMKPVHRSQTHIIPMKNTSGRIAHDHPAAAFEKGFKGLSRSCGCCKRSTRGRYFEFECYVSAAKVKCKLPCWID